MLTVHTTCGSKQEAEKIAKALVKENLAACATYFPVSSIYLWQGKIAAHDEFLLELKTKSSNYSKVEARIKSLHSYSVPQIVAYQPKKVEKKYAKWIDG